MVDFSLLGAQPNYLSLYKTSYDAGATQAKEDRVANALQTAGTDLAGAEKELISLGAFDEAHQLRSIRVDQARAKAAKAALALDYSGAASAAAEGGDVAAVQDFQTQGRKVALGGQVAAGDYAGAQTDALKAGDFDVAAAVQGMDTKERAQVAERADTIAAISQKLKGQPYETRKAAIASIAPALKARGFSDEQVQGFLDADPTDANLDAAVASSMSLKEVLAAAKDDKGVVVGDGATLVDPRTGKPLYSNPKNFAPPKASSAATGGLPPGYEPL